MTDKGYNEKEIAARLKDESRRAAAFSVIVNRYSQQIYWNIRRMVLSHDDANDLVQNTFVKAWTNIEKFRGESQISTWLYRIAINETLNFLAKNTDNTVSLDSPEGAVAEMLEKKCTYVEIAEKTGASTATISRVNRSLIYGTDGYQMAFARLAEKKKKEEK